ncbi:uncharacterized protein LOC126311232 [Schistocerca gregaria]|uniref:uncharacterized protein LOC126311232 n=1 Tax=Schistocerca gregaria TaxID=7010 RepID=UPI00211ECC9D|nr:uncharacterized protein LOC126311232 [Schistocerca gregaria]
MGAPTGGDLVQEMLLCSPYSETLVEKLVRFNAIHVSSETTCDIYEPCAREKLVTMLADLISHSPLPTSAHQIRALAPVVHALQILAREQDGSSPLFTSSFVKDLTKISGLQKFIQITQQDEFETLSFFFPLLEPALKCLANLVLKEDRLLADFIAEDGPIACRKIFAYLIPMLAAATTRNPTPNFDEAYDFILVGVLRLLVLSTRITHPTCKGTIYALRESRLLEDLTDYVVLYSKFFKPAPVHIATHTSLQDALRCILNLIADFGVFGSSKNLAELDKCIPKLSLTFDAWITFLDYDDYQSKSHPVYTLQTLVVSCLVNLPIERIKELFSARQPQLTPQQLIHHILHILSVSLLGVDSQLEDERHCIPLLMLVTDVAKAIPDIRTHCLSQLFLHRISEEQLANLPQTCSLGGHIIQLMTSGDTTTKYWANELIFTVCNNNLDLFARVAGPENVSNLLAKSDCAEQSTSIHRSTPPVKSPK